MSDISEHFNELRQWVSERTTGQEQCVIAETVASEADVVYVTLPNSDNPEERYEIDYWRLSVTAMSGSLQPRYPTQDAEAMVLYMDTGEMWLIY
jgi:hypothetical protein